MKEFPSYPPPADAPPDLLERGHLWLHELVDGAPFRFHPLDDGRLRFGDEVRTFGDSPPEYDHVVRYLRENFDREALRAAVDDVESVVFFGRAMHRRGVDYDWASTPNFLGVDVWSATADAYLRPDRVEKIYRRLGLTPVNVVRAELRAADFAPERYTFPPSEWYDGPAAGVLLRNKTGHRARLDNPDVGSETNGRDSDRVDSGETFARDQATSARLETVANRLQADDRPVTFDTLYERAVETIVRAHHDRLFDGRDDVDMRAFRSAVAEQVQSYLAGRE